jgi:hypothetical protein
MNDHVAEPFRTILNNAANIAKGETFPVEIGALRLASYGKDTYLEDAEGENVAMMLGDPRNPITKAYWRTLAAAPELLAACEKALPFCTAHWADCTCGGGGADPHCERHALADQLRAAIAKARGQA